MNPGKFLSQYFLGQQEPERPPEVWAPARPSVFLPKTPLSHGTSNKVMFSSEKEPMAVMFFRSVLEEAAGAKGLQGRLRMPKALEQLRK